jgi:hypothetical protein
MLIFRKSFTKNFKISFAENFAKFQIYTMKM